MHYKNGREAKVGDWVVGPTHNSNNSIRIGYVIELMPKQGPCNVKMLYWESERIHEDGGGHTIPITEAIPKVDYADAAELILCADGHRMVSAIEGHGKWNGPYQ